MGCFNSFKLWRAWCCNYFCFCIIFVTCIHLWMVNLLYDPLLILLTIDGKSYPGSRHNSCESYSICHWNLNSVSAYNYTKLFFLKAYIAVLKFDIICLSETYLDYSVVLDADNLEILGHSLLRSDHPSSNKLHGVCVYYKNVLQVLDIQYLHECIGFELIIGDKICNFVTLYRSPGQMQDKFEKFSHNLELNLQTLAQKSLSCCSYWWRKIKKLVLENTTLQFGLQQIIKEPTHILDHSSSCIDLKQSNLITESEVHPSWLPNCHHQVVYEKFNFQIYLPPQYFIRGRAMQRFWFKF